MKKGHIGTAPRVSEGAAQFYPTIFSSLNAGLEFTIEGFPVLYRRTLHGLKGRFEQKELSLMIDVFKATMLTPQMAGQHLAAQVADGIALDRLDQKWGIDGNALNNKIASLTVFEAACLEIWANGFWYRHTSELACEELEGWIEQIINRR
jgi:hypothetical protein